MNIEKYRDLVSKDSTMSSRDLHEFVFEATGKFKELKHFHEKIKSVLEIDGLKFRPTLRANGQVEYYNLDEIECNMIMASVDVKHLRLVSEVFVAVKHAIVKDSYMISNPIERAKAWIVEEEVREKLQIENKAKSLKIAQDAPKVLFATNVTKAINSINIGSYGKALSEEYGIKIGQNKLFAFLRSSGILIKSGRRKNAPMQKYMGNNYFIVVENEIATPRGIIVKPTTLITGKGQLSLADMVINHFS